jgi:DNA-binding PadR family transcriptional regulator
MGIEVTGTVGLPTDGAVQAADRASANPGGRTSLAEPTILCALASRPIHGYELKQAVQEITGGFLSLDPPGIYRMLRHLEETGMVESSWTPGESGPQRREYTLTDAGRVLLADWGQFLTRQRQACLLTVNAIDAALGIANQTVECADPPLCAPAEPGGGA